MNHKDHVSLLILAILFIMAIVIGAGMVSCSSETKTRKVCIYDYHDIPQCHYEDSMGRPVYTPHEGSLDEDGM